MMEIGFTAGARFGLALAGGYAVQAHELVERPSKDVDFAYSRQTPISEIVDVLADAYRAAGYDVRMLGATERVARMYVDTPEGGCEVDVLMEALQPPVRMTLGPVVSFEDAVGLKVRALYGRSVHRDLIDVHAAHEHFGWQALEALCRRHQPEFLLSELADRLDAVDFLNDDDFRAYGQSDEQIAELRRWAVAWRDDIGVRLASGQEDAGQLVDWDRYLDR